MAVLEPVASGKALGATRHGGAASSWCEESSSLTQWFSAAEAIFSSWAVMTVSCRAKCSQLVRQLAFTFSFSAASCWRKPSQVSVACTSHSCKVSWSSAICCECSCSLAAASSGRWLASWSCSHTAWNSAVLWVSSQSVRDMHRDIQAHTKQTHHLSPRVPPHTPFWGPHSWSLQRSLYSLSLATTASMHCRNWSVDPEVGKCSAWANTCQHLQLPCSQALRVEQIVCTGLEDTQYYMQVTPWWSWPIMFMLKLTSGLSSLTVLCMPQRRACSGPCPSDNLMSIPHLCQFRFRVEFRFRVGNRSHVATIRHLVLSIFPTCVCFVTP